MTLPLLESAPAKGSITSALTRLRIRIPCQKVMYLCKTFLQRVDVSSQKGSEVRFKVHVDTLLVVHLADCPVRR